jgi:hypothetical protein
MNRRFRHAFVAVCATIGLSSPSRQLAATQAEGPEQRIAALKQSLQASQAGLRKYEWIETTTISLKGEEKSRRQQRCHYGDDGAVQKIPIAGDAPPQADQRRGRRGGRLKERVVENKKEELQDYMKEAVTLIHQYVPPKPADIDRAKQAGKLVIRPGQAGHARVEFADYLKPGDTLGIEVDSSANRLAGVDVASYLAKPEDAVTLGVRFGTLVDGTSYAAETTLDAKAKHLRVVVTNSGHRPIGQ